MSERPLARVLGARTTILIGLGVAIGSGILRTPPLVAQALGRTEWVLLAWGLGGLAIFASSLVMAELATRFPESGGEYAWLREAYGPFVAFFFGWGYTIFIVGGGAATIAAAFGDAAVTLFGGGLSSRGWAALGVVLVASANMLGLRAGAAIQNALTLSKVAIVLAIAVVAFTLVPEARPERSTEVESLGIGAWVAALPPVIWAYAGSTDAVKLAGEVDRPSRSIPLALLGATGALTLIYLVVNAGLLWGLGVDGVAASPLPAADVARRAFGERGGLLVAGGSAIVFLGALSSTLLATVRVAWALGHDGYGFGFLGWMSRGQAPVGAIAFVAGVALVFALGRDFEDILGIYFLAGALLFGLVYASLLVFRARDHRGGGPPPGAFRCPVPHLLVGLMILVQGAMAVVIIIRSPVDAAATLGLLFVVAVAYGLVHRRRS